MPLTIPFAVTAAVPLVCPPYSWVRCPFFVVQRLTPPLCYGPHHLMLPKDFLPAVITISFLNLQFLPRYFILQYACKCAPLSPTLKNMKAPPDSRLFLFPFYYAALIDSKTYREHCRSQVLPLFFLHPGRLPPPPLLRDGSRHSDLLLPNVTIISVTLYLTSWHYWAISPFLKPFSSLGFGDLHLGFRCFKGHSFAGFPFCTQSLKVESCRVQSWAPLLQHHFHLGGHLPLVHQWLTKSMPLVLTFFWNPA